MEPFDDIGHIISGEIHSGHPLRTHLEQSNQGTESIPFLNMAYRRSQRSIRESYDEQFVDRDVREVREVRLQRVVNIVEKRTTVTPPELEYDRGYEDQDQWYGNPRSYQDQRGYRGEGAYQSSDRGYSEEKSFANPETHRSSSPPPKEDPYHYYGASRDDGHVKRHVEIRSSGRGSPYYRSRGRGFAHPRMSMSHRGKHKPKPLPPYADRGEDHGEYRRRDPYVSPRVRSPIRKDALPPIPARSGSNSSSRSYSPDRENSYSYQQPHQRHEPSVQTSDAPSEPVQAPPHSSVPAEETPPASSIETEEVVAASTEPKLTPQEDFKARRAEAISAKALEIETLYRQDCETFGTVVNMLVAKQPSLDTLLQAPMTENLVDIKQRCLDDLKHFIKELDQIIQQPETSL